MASSANICVGCGLCCDGHLFGFVPIKPEEQDNCAALGLEVEQVPDAHLRFHQPCPRFGDGGCTVYDRRPSICRSFRCLLLKDHDAGRISTQEAEAVIAQVHAFDWHGTLGPQLEQIVPRPKGSVATHLATALQAVSASPDAADLRRRHGLLLVRAAALVNLLRNRFDKRVDEDPAQSPDAAKDG
jgi:Fe-S-cluster containining protein